MAVAAPFIVPMTGPRRRGLGLLPVDLAPCAAAGDAQARSGPGRNFTVVPQRGRRFDGLIPAAHAEGALGFEEIHAMADAMMQRFGISPAIESKHDAGGVFARDGPSQAKISKGKGKGKLQQQFHPKASTTAEHAKDRLNLAQEKDSTSLDASTPDVKRPSPLLCREELAGEVASARGRSASVASERQHSQPVSREGTMERQTSGALPLCGRAASAASELRQSPPSSSRQAEDQDSRAPHADAAAVSAAPAAHEVAPCAEQEATTATHQPAVAVEMACQTVISGRSRPSIPVTRPKAPRRVVATQTPPPDTMSPLNPAVPAHFYRPKAKSLPPRREQMEPERQCFCCSQKCLRRQQVRSAEALGPRTAALSADTPKGQQRPSSVAGLRTQRRSAAESWSDATSPSSSSKSRRRRWHNQKRRGPLASAGPARVEAPTGLDLCDSRQDTQALSCSASAAASALPGPRPPDGFALDSPRLSGPRQVPAPFGEPGVRESWLLPSSPRSSPSYERGLAHVRELLPRRSFEAVLPQPAILRRESLLPPTEAAEGASLQENPAQVIGMSPPREEQRHLHLQSLSSSGPAEASWQERCSGAAVGVLPPMLPSSTSLRWPAAPALGLDAATLELEALVEESHRALIRDGLLSSLPGMEQHGNDEVEDVPAMSIPSLDAVDRALEELQRGLAEIDSALARPKIRG